MVNKQIGVTLLLAIVLAIGMVLPAVAEGNETNLSVVTDESATSLPIMTETGAGQATEETLEEPDSDFTGFPYSVVFLGTEYEVWRVWEPLEPGIERTTITAGLMPIDAPGTTNWGMPVNVISSVIHGSYYCAWSPPSEAVGRQYNITFVAEYRNEDGVVYRQDGDSVSETFEVATFSMPTTAPLKP